VNSTGGVPVQAIPSGSHSDILKLSVHRWQQPVWLVSQGQTVWLVSQGQLEGAGVHWYISTTQITSSCSWRHTDYTRALLLSNGVHTLNN